MVATLSTFGQSELLRGEFSSLQGQIQRIQTQVATGQVTQVYGDLGAQTSLDISLRQQANVLDDFHVGFQRSGRIFAFPRDTSLRRHGRRDWAEHDIFVREFF